MTHPREHNLPDFPGGPRPFGEIARDAVAMLPRRVLEERERALFEDPVTRKAVVKLVAKLAAGLRAVQDRSAEEFVTIFGRHLDPVEFHVLKTCVAERADDLAAVPCGNPWNKYTDLP